MSNIVGISAHYHDSACCLLRDGVLVCAAEEERFSRLKHDSGLPWRAFQYCLAEGGLTLADVDCIAYYENPTKKLARQLWMGLHPGVSERSRRSLLGRLQPGRVERDLRLGLGYEGPVETFDHHASHAASSYYFSGFDDAAILTVDGVGEWATTTLGRGQGGEIEIQSEVHFPHSLGLFYSTITAYLGFEVNEGEYKVMGLAPYGEPRYAGALRSLVELDGQGGYRLDLRYFDFLAGERMYSDRLSLLLGREPRPPGAEVERFHQDVARSLQVVLEEVLLDLARALKARVPSENLCMAGGVALNCVANARILREGIFQRLFVQPAASDAGGALGAAALAQARRGGLRPRRLDHVYLGPSYSDGEVRELLAATAARYEDYSDRTEELLDAVVERLAAGKVVGWFQGRMELGPRALGARSILADPRHPGMRDRINSLVKQREAFRPFAPAVLWAKAREHFDIDHPSPYMLETCQVCSPLDLPAVTHVDGSARLQTVDRRVHPRFARLLEKLDERTGCPILLNTSFNMKGEPIVCSPADALACFVRARMDSLVLEGFLLDHEGIPPLWQWLTLVAPPRSAGQVSHEVYTLL